MNFKGETQVRSLIVYTGIFAEESAGCVDDRRGYLGVRVPTRPLGGVLYENTCNRRSRVCRKKPC